MLLSEETLDCFSSAGWGLFENSPKESKIHPENKSHCKCAVQPQDREWNVVWSALSVKPFQGYPHDELKHTFAAKLDRILTKEPPEKKECYWNRVDESKLTICDIAPEIRLVWMMQIHKEIDFSLIKVKKETVNNLKQTIKQCNSAKTLKIKEKINEKPP